MFQDLDTTLENLLSGAAFPPALGPVEISFKKPDKTVSFNGATISLFLYSAKENRQLRDPMPIVEFIGGTFRRRRPPMRVDCDYIVTAWHTGLSLDARVAAEHQLLATALTRLSGFPTVPAPMLAGAMAGQPFPVPLWVAQEEESKSLGEFWSSLGISPCASFHLMATIALDPGVATVEGPPATTLNRSLDDDLDRLTVGESMFTFGGHVRNAAGDAIPNALVTLDGGIQTHTDADGAFVFPRVAAGTHTLVITSGALSANRSIAIPPDPNALPPPTLTDFDFVL